MNYATNFKSIRDQVSPEEWEARVKLAACYRLIDKYDMADLIYNHITARIRARRIISDQSLRVALQGDHRVELGQDRSRGQYTVKPGTDYDINKSGYVIHGAIHRRGRR
jgi:ribulose-5-phosphate 4-epimerase/fuculose-1-phosphate aldolase